MGPRPGPAAPPEFLDEEHGGYKIPEPGNSISSATTLGAKVSRILVLHDFRSTEVIQCFQKSTIRASSPVNTLESIPQDDASPC